jgi:DNA-binding GntR family transcriptional regulator
VGLDAIGFSHQPHNLHTVLKALEKRDAEKARRAMEEHVDQYAAQVKEKFL